MFCPNCGNDVKHQEVYCASCGNKLEGNDTTNNNTVFNTTQGEYKSRIAAGVLGICLGSLGIHNFYLGYTGKGMAQLLISVLTFGFLAWISAIWGLIEGIQILTGSIKTDANGVPLKD